MSTSRNSRPASRSSGRSQSRKRINQENDYDNDQQSQNSQPQDNSNSTIRSSSSLKSKQRSGIKTQSDQQKYATYIKSPIIGHEPVTEFDRALEDVYGKFCRESLHIGETYVNRMSDPNLNHKDEERKMNQVPYARRSINQTKRMEQLQQEFPDVSLKDVTNRPDCGQHYRFEGLHTNELWWYYHDKAKTIKWRNFFDQYDNIPPPPYSEKQENRIRDQLINILNTWQEDKDNYLANQKTLRKSSRKSSRKSNNDNINNNNNNNENSSLSSSKQQSNSTRKSGRKSGRKSMD